MTLIYFLTNSDGNGFTKKNETYECFEIADITKAFKSIRTLVESAVEKGGSAAEMRQSKSFMGSAQFSKMKTLSPVKSK